MSSWRGKVNRRGGYLLVDVERFLGGSSKVRRALDLLGWPKRGRGHVYSRAQVKEILLAYHWLRGRQIVADTPLARANEERRRQRIAQQEHLRPEQRQYKSVMKGLPSRSRPKAFARLG